MSNVDRRGFVSRLGLGAACVGVSPVRRWLSPARPGLEEIARRLTRCSREEAFAAAVGLLREGATWQDLLGGTFLAGVRDIKPQPVGFQFHAVMMVESAFQLAEAAPAGHRLWPVFFNIDDFKRSQAQDKARGDWVLQPRRDASSLRPSVARRRLLEAMENQDEARADQAIASLFASQSKDDLFEVLWPLGGRDFTNIGHKIIYTAHAYRTLTRIGWRHGLPVLRSLILGLLDGDGKDPSIARFRDNQKLARGLRKDWQGGRADPEASLALLVQLRQTKTADAASVVAQASAKGVTAASIWDGYRLFAGEMLMHDPGILPVHPTTATNSMHFAWRTARRDATRRVLLLQGASWLASYRDFFARRGGDKRDRPRIESLRAAAQPPGSAGSIFDTAAKDTGRAAAELLALDSGAVPAFTAALRHQVFTKGTEHHLYKYAAAVLEDIRGCHPSLANRLLAAGLGYIPSTGAADSAVHQRTRRALES